MAIRYAYLRGIAEKTNMKNARKSARASRPWVVAVSICTLVVGVALVSSAAGDELELKNGKVYKGKLLSETHDKMVFLADFEGAKIELDFPKSNVKAVTVKGARRLVKPGPKPVAKPDPADIPKNDRTETQVDDLVENVGRTKPKWYESVPLRFPRTLKLNWRVTSRGWKPHVNLRQYIDGIVSPSPDKWKEGIKLMHHTVTINRTSLTKLRMSQRALADMYFSYFGDYARAAFWYRQSRGRNHVPLASCYFHLGCKKLAVKVLSEINDDYTPNGGAIRLWAEMNEVDRALFYAEKAARAGRPDVGYLAAGDACRRDGQYAKARSYYQKVLDAERGGRDIKRNTARAKANLEAVKLQTALKISQIPDGIYPGESPGYSKTSPIQLAVTVASGKIESIKIQKPRDQRYYTSLTEMPKRIIAKQFFLAPPAPDPKLKIRTRRRPSVVITEEPGTIVEWLAFRGLDTVSGATETSQGIFNATVKALSAGMPKTGE